MSRTVMPLAALFSLFVATCFGTTLSAQNIVNDPYFKSSSAWTTVDPATNAVSWGPLVIETRVLTAANANKTVGVKQTINVQADGYYQLIMNADTSQVGQTGGIPFNCVLKSGSTTVLSASGASNQGPDTRMKVAMLTKGSYELEVTTKTVLDNISTSYRLIHQGTFLRPVTLPCPNFHLVSNVVTTNQSVEVNGQFNPAATACVYVFASQRLSTSLRFPGVFGEVSLDPNRGTGLLVSLLKPVSNAFVVFPWTRAWPAYHCQIVEFDASMMTVRVGSRTFSRPQ